MLTFFLLPVLWVGYTLDLDQTMALFSTPFHELCVHLAPDSSWQEAYAALVCGSNLASGDFFEALKKTSLLHLAIVSGSHLLLLEQILWRLRPPSSSHWPQVVSGLLFLYALLTGWQAPAVRSWFTLLLQGLNHYGRLKWSPLQVTGMAGFLCWALFPRWAQSFSLLLSWGAALALALPLSTSRGWASEWRTHLVVYTVLTPLLLPLSAPHPLTILCNWWIGPLLGLLLFPLSLVAYIVPWVTPLIDPFWSFTAALTQWLSSFIPTVTWKSTNSAFSLWWYLFSLQLASQTLNTWLRRVERA